MLINPGSSCNEEPIAGFEFPAFQSNTGSELCSHQKACFIFISKDFLFPWGERITSKSKEWEQLQTSPPRELSVKWVKFHCQVWTGKRRRQPAGWSQLRDLAEVAAIDVSPKGTGNVSTLLYVHKSKPSIEEGLNLLTEPWEYNEQFQHPIHSQQIAAPLSFLL